MSTSRLKLYNDALLVCGERTLSSLTENREPRYLLDHVWDNDGVRTCLEAGQWRFAMRTAMIDYDSAIEPDFGYRRAFAKPTDWCVTSAVCEDEFFNVPLLRYVDEASYWYSDLDTIYARFVSDDTAYGNDLSLWPGNFTRFVASDFASRIILKLTSDENKRTGVLAERKRLLKLAKSTDAMADPTKFPAEGNWTSSRRRGPSRRDRGNRNNLIG